LKTESRIEFGRWCRRYLPRHLHLGPLPPSVRRHSVGHASAIVTHTSSRWTRAPLLIVWLLSAGHALCARALGGPRLAAVRPAAPKGAVDIHQTCHISLPLP
jgi:hypothetical protein